MITLALCCILWHGIRQGLKFILLHMDIKWSRDHYYQHYSFPIKLSWHHCENQLSINLFLQSKFFCMYLCICPMGMFESSLLCRKPLKMEGLSTKMAQHMKATGAKSDNLNSITKTHTVEARPSSCALTSTCDPIRVNRIKKMKI